MTTVFRHLHTHRSSLLAAAIVVVAGAATACEASCSMSTAKLSDERMASAIDVQTKAPTAVVTTFAPDAQAIYATAKLDNAPDGTKVRATFHYLEGGERQVAQDEVEAGGSRYVAFTLTPPANGWPAGQYETRFFLNGKEVKRQPFNIVATAAVPPAPPAGAFAPPLPPAAAAPPPPSRPSDVKRFSDDTFGFEFEAPATWTYRVTESKDYLVEGPKGSDAFELSIVLQFVMKSANPGSSAGAELEKLAAQIQRAPNSAIRSRDIIPIAGQDAPSFVATYTAKNSQGAATGFGHFQVVVDHGAYYYLISYSGPEAIYTKYRTVFQGVVKTLRLR